MPSVACLVSSTAQADQIMGALHTDGIDEKRISVLFPDPRQPRGLGLENSGPMAPGPIVGPGTGMAMGSLFGWIVGAAAFAIPGAGPFIAAGPILSALGGATIGATVGALAGGLIGLGMPDAQAEYYENKIREGRYMIWVEVGDKEQIARTVATFERHGAEDITLSVAAAQMMGPDATKYDLVGTTGQEKGEDENPQEVG